MNLKSATVYTIIGISYFYLVRTIGTIIPDIFRVQDIAQGVQLLSLFAALAPLVFLAYFYKDYLRSEQVLLKNITVITLIGFSLIVFLHIRELFMVFPRMSSILYNFSPSLYQLVHSRQIPMFGSLISWVTSIAVFLFFVVFYRETARRNQVSLKNATLIAMVGSSLALLLRTISTIVSLSAGAFPIRTLISPIIITPVLVLSLLGILSIIYFLYTFYRAQV